ncbi:uncharacterized protein RAG0_06276 [Rhynchosporium agropyri]|uniref:Uncharacterized protein n=1 Tax=Rhynchosporium agropyri TaxID=914238 RepID=A0A1E1KGI1_9HELO|nr:uncharacterized protein RAG0_06276 [Rhynchosporium agropyri]
MNPLTSVRRDAMAEETTAPIADTLSVACPPSADYTPINDTNTDEKYKIEDNMAKKEDSGDIMTAEEIKEKIQNEKNRRNKAKKNKKASRNKDAFRQLQALKDARLAGTGNEAVAQVSQSHSQATSIIAGELNARRQLHVTREQPPLQDAIIGATVLGKETAPVPTVAGSCIVLPSTIHHAEAKVRTLSIDPPSHLAIRSSSDAIDNYQETPSDIPMIFSGERSLIDFESYTDVGSLVVALEQHTYVHLPKSESDSEAEEGIAAQLDGHTNLGAQGCDGCADLIIKWKGARDVLDRMFEMFKANAQASHDEHMIDVRAARKDSLEYRDKHKETLKKSVAQEAELKNEKDKVQRLSELLKTSKDSSEIKILRNAFAERNKQLYACQNELAAEKIKNEEINNASDRTMNASSQTLIDLQKRIIEQGAELEKYETEKKFDKTKSDALMKIIETKNTNMTTLQKQFNEQNRNYATLKQQSDEKAQRLAKVHEELKLEKNEKEALIEHHKSAAERTTKEFSKLQEKVNEKSQALKDASIRLKDEEAARTVFRDAKIQQVAKLQHRIDEQNQASENVKAKFENEKTARTILIKQTTIDKLVESADSKKLNRSLQALAIGIFFMNLAAFFAGQYINTSQAIAPISNFDTFYKNITKIDESSKWNAPTVAELILLTHTTTEGSPREF